MASVAGRKKSIVSATGIQIDTPVPNNTLLNKAASQSTSLYQQCSALRSRLMRIHRFDAYFSLSASADSRQSTDPVTQLWDLFSLGAPLCYIWNLLPPPAQNISQDIDPSTFDVTNEKVKKRCIALFAMQIRTDSECEAFTVTDLWDRNSTDGLVKVINTVITLVDRLPEDRFEELPKTPPGTASHDSLNSLASDSTLVSVPTQGKETARNNIIREMVETERKYVADLETMQRYSKELSQGNTIDQDTIHLLFPNLNKLLNFQRKFLIRLESTAEMTWKDQRWGSLFIESEDDFTVYEPYCANYTNAAELMLAEEQNLLSQSDLINAKTELPAFLIKPVQRICKYPLLLDSLVKAASPEDYPHYDELKEGSSAAKRITDKINEAQRRAENIQTVKNLQTRIEDWKGHHLSNFGDLLLDDIFVVMKSDVDREYHVFLFEKIILCCKEVLPTSANASKKVGKSNSILKKQTSSMLLPTGGGQAKRKNTPLLLKGRIFLNNITRAVPASPRNPGSSSTPNQYALEVWWRGDDDMEFFTLRCRSEEQLKQWETTIGRLITEAATRRASERNITRVAAGTPSNSLSSGPLYLSALPVRPGSGNRMRISPVGGEGQSSVISPTSGYGEGPQGYPPHGGFELEPDDDFEDYPFSGTYPSSGRTTPAGVRRGTSQSLPPEREHVVGYERPRARTEDQNGPNMAQWRMNGSVAHLPVHGLPVRPAPSRGPSTISTASYASNASDSSFGPGMRARTAGLRSQFSSTKLKASYDNDENAVNGSGHMGPIRSRSASHSQTYMSRPPAVPPPLPTSTIWPNRSNPMTAQNKRGSGSSQSTGESSDYSPNSSSPITPYGSSESSLGGMHGPQATRTQEPEQGRNGASLNLSPPIKVKVHFHEDIFVIQVPRSMEFEDLVERVGKKIRLCGPRRDDGPLRVKYRDEDGDMISLGSTEDVQMAFEQYRPGGQVTLYVQ